MNKEKILFIVYPIFLTCIFSCSTPAQQKPHDNLSNKKHPMTSPHSYSSISEIRNLGKGSDFITLTAPEQSGSFRYAPEDKTSFDNGGTVIVTKSGRRYKRVMDGPINAKLHFLAKGDGKSDDTKALQQAVDAACGANNPARNGLNSPSNGSNTVYIPHGSYRITDEILIRGACSIIMEGANSYGGTRIRQIASGKHLFHIV